MNDFYDEIKQIFVSHEVAMKYFKLTIFLFIIAIAYNLFIIPIDLVAGGSGGLGVLFYNIFSISFK